MVRAAATLAFLCTLSAPAQDDALRRRPDPTTLRADAHLVSLDVIVLDKNGRTAKGLTPSDFTLFEDGQPQTITGFQEHTRPYADDVATLRLAAALPPNTFTDAPSPIPESTTIVIVIDRVTLMGDQTYNAGLADQMFLRQEMLGYMKSVPPGTRIAILRSDSRLHLVQSPTSDPAELFQAIKGDRDYPGVTFTTSDLCGSSPANCNNLHPQDTQKGIVPELATFLAGIPGRKSLIWFYGAGFPTTPRGLTVHPGLPDATRTVEQVGRSYEELTLQHLDVYLSYMGNGDPTGPPKAVDRRELSQGAISRYDSNDLKGVIAQIADTAWNYYTISYTPTNRVFRGELRNISLNVPIPKAELQYRRGYYAFDSASRLLSRKDRQNANQLVSGAVSQPVGAQINSAIRIGVATPHDVLFTAHLTPSHQVDQAPKHVPLPPQNYLAAKFRKKPYRNYDIHYAVDPATLLLMEGPDHLKLGQLELVALLFDDLGNQINSISSKASVHANAATWPDLQKTGVQIDQTIALPAKGVYFLRLGVHDRTGDKLGAIEIPVDDIKLNLPQ